MFFRQEIWGQENDAENLTINRWFSFNIFVTTEKVDLWQNSGEFLQWTFESVWAAGKEENFSPLALWWLA